jgi:nicotinate dehydrogenase subunit B
MKRGISRDSELQERPTGFVLDRRDFLKVVGGGIVVFFTAGVLPAQEGGGRRMPPGQPLPTDFNAFLRIGADGRVACFTGKVEMGQGIVTSLAQMLADELDVPLDRVDMIMGDTDLCPWDMGTFGSMSTRFFGPPLRQAASEARSVLLALASEHLKVPERQLTIRDGVVSDSKDKKRQVTYTQLAKGKYIERHLPAKPPVKRTAEYKIMGVPHKRTDSLKKVTGEALYAGDLRLPGMLYATILRPPAHGAKLKKVDASALKADREAILVEEGDLIAVLHPLPDMAEKAVSRIKAEFELPATGLDDTTIFKHLLSKAPKEAEIASEGGNLKDGEQLATRLFEETYYDHYVAHAPIETHTAVAQIDKDKVTVWASTQRPFGAKEEVAQALKVPPQKVRIITPFVGGGFGGKNANGQAVEAARLAKLTGKPVQVMWSRKEEFFNDTFRPAAVVKIRSGLNDGGSITFWQYDVYWAGSRGAEQIYAIANHKEAAYGQLYGPLSGVHPFAVGPWRAPGNNTNSFARESHMDIMAAKTGIDPLAFRLKHLKDQRIINTLKAAAARFGWKEGVAPSKRGFGIACGIDAGACVATIVEVAVDRGTGQVRVERIVCAQEMGFIINPEGATLQMEGCLTMGLGYALKEQIQFKDGRVLTENFDTYEIPRFSWLPKVETVLVENPGLPPQGGGEPAIICVGAAIGNAIFDATGARLYQMAMTSDRVKEALAKSRI